MSSINKKKVSAVAAVAVAAALALGGTFAWQGYQSALNEASDVVNPGGRLHDDFDGSNKDVYVENFAEDDIFARVRLSEYFEIVMNQGTPAEKIEVITGERGEDGATGEVTRSYVTHFFGQVNDTDPWWTWQTGGETTYMPTFNKNKDSLVADVNGTYGYVDLDTGEAVPYGDYVDYSLPANATEEGVEIYDADANDADEVGANFNDLETYVNSGSIVTVSKDEDGRQITHSVQQTGSGELVSMDEWFALHEAGKETYGYWVYDTDGWVYWSSPIEGSSATGLLLDGIEPVQVMDDSWYYAINVEAQFVTADDLGSVESGDGFYANNEQPTEAALELLGIIGVDVPGAEGGDMNAVPVFTVGDITNTAVLDYNLSSGDTVIAYQGTQIQVVSTNASTNWTVTGYTSSSSGGAGAPELDGEGYSRYLFNIGEDEQVGTKITFTQTAGDGTQYTLNVVVASVPSENPDSYAVKLYSKQDNGGGSIECVDAFRCFTAGTKVFFSIEDMTYGDFATFVAPDEAWVVGNDECDCGKEHMASLQIPAGIDTGSYEILAIGKDGTVYVVPIDVVKPYSSHS